MGLPSPSNRDFFLKIRRKFKSYLRWLKKVPEGLYVMTPVTLPFFGSTGARMVNRFLLFVQVRLAMMLIGIYRPVLWVAIPTAADVAPHFNAKIILYQVSDKYDANEDSALSKDVIRSLDAQLKSLAQVVMYSGRRLFAESTLPNRYFLEQAVDYDRFASPVGPTAEEIAAIPHPVLGYFGAIDYVMDVPLIEEVAKRRPDWHWVFIGMRSNLVQIDVPNVHFLGSKPYADLPRYVRHIDIFVLPWRQENAFTGYGSAIKVREYLATGKPVVISP